MTSKQFEARIWRTGFDYVVLLVRFTRMLPFACLDHIDLSTCWTKRPHATAYTKEEQFGYVAEVKADSAAVWAAVFATLRPY
jgi:hypothetical protein